MVGIIECVLAIGAITIAGMIAGRIAAMILIALTTATGALIMPPFLSWQVDNDLDLLALLFQNVVGLIVAYRSPVRPRPISTRNARRSPVSCHHVDPMRLSAERRNYSLPTVVSSIMEGNANLIKRAGDLEVYGELDGRIAVSQDVLERLVLDVLRLAFSDSRVQHVSVYTERQPALDRIDVVAEYDVAPALPRIRLLGRSDGQYQIPTDNWPPNCSAASFDNGHEQTYLISIYKRNAG
ncbi:MAG TPA: hypothetical protein VER98_11610 [Terriglobia bacterium]|nr:hypothetical protein [Terriglobia bacterium]